MAVVVATGDEEQSLAVRTLKESRPGKRTSAIKQLSNNMILMN